MFVSIDWIKDYVDLSGINTDELINKFTLGTAEIEGHEESNKFLEEIKVVEIVNIEKHPEADKLNLVKFKLSETETFQVVCGAGNVKVGLKVPYAKIGVTLPGGWFLEPKKIRGVLSEGMLCSSEELGLEKTNDGLMELPEDISIGTNMSSVLKINPDLVIDIDNKSLTHRPDLWGHYGLAREFSALFNKPLADYLNADNNIDLKVTNDGPIKVKVDSDSSCLSYMGLSINNIQVSESPKWMQDRLLKMGINPKNSIVDISNYVMMDIGLPNHIFDADKISGDIHIKQIGKELKFKSLDGETRSLLPRDTVVCDDKEPLVIAGIIGGNESAVSDATKNIFIEVATWKAPEVRKTSTRLSLRTDSSQRFEKSLDPYSTMLAMKKIVGLVRELNPGANIQGGLSYDGIDLSSKTNLSIKTSMHKINAVLGTNLDETSIVNILSSLSFKVEENGGELNVIVPSFRATKDIECEDDLIEEVGRVIGYDNITPVPPSSNIFPMKICSQRKLQRDVRSFLTKSDGATEVFSYPLVGKKTKTFGYPQSEELELINALSEDHKFMRDNLINSFLEKVLLNSKNEENFKLFEIGRVYSADKKNYAKESTQIALCHFSRKSSSTFINLVNTVETLMSFLGLPYDLVTKSEKFKNNVVKQSWEGIHPVEFINVKLMGTLEGAIFTVHPLLLKNNKIKGTASIAILDLNKLSKKVPAKKIKYTPLPKFPGSTFDCSVVCSIEVSVQDILSCFKKVKAKEFKRVKVSDVFKLNEESKSVTLSFKFLDSDSTISSKRLKELESLVIEALEKNNYYLKK